MKLEHVKIGRDYMWGDKRVTVRAVTDARRDGDPEGDGDDDLIDTVTVADVGDDGVPVWQYAPVTALRPLPVTALLDDMRANYAHNFVPDDDVQSASAEVERAPGTVYQRWADVPNGVLVLDGEGDGAQRFLNGDGRFWYPRVKGHWWAGPPWGGEIVGIDDFAPWTLVAEGSDNVTAEQVTELARGKR